MIKQFFHQLAMLLTMIVPVFFMGIIGVQKENLFLNWLCIILLFFLAGCFLCILFGKKLSLLKQENVEIALFLTYIEFFILVFLFADNVKDI